MDRRTFVATSAAALALPRVADALTGREASPEDVLLALGQGETLFLDFYASWCTTCRAQERAVNALKAENPSYEEAMTFLSVDWDKHSGSELAKALNIPRRSTLVVIRMQPDQTFLMERVVAETSRASIKALLDKGLGIAGS